MIPQDKPKSQQSSSVLCHKNDDDRGDSNHPERRVLLLKMYDTLRKEVENFMKELGTLVAFGIVTTGGVWTWVLTHYEKRTEFQSGVVAVFLFLPAILVGLLLIRAHALRMMIHKASDHLGAIEEEFGVSGDLRWDSLWRNRRESIEHSFLKSTLGFWLYLIWIFLILVNLAAGTVLAFCWWPDANALQLAEFPVADCYIALFVGLFLGNVSLFQFAHSRHHELSVECFRIRREVGDLRRKAKEALERKATKEIELLRAEEEAWCSTYRSVLQRYYFSTHGIRCVPVGFVALALLFLIVLAGVKLPLFLWYLFLAVATLPLLLGMLFISTGDLLRAARGQRIMDEWFSCQQSIGGSSEQE